MSKTCLLLYQNGHNLSPAIHLKMAAKDISGSNSQPWEFIEVKNPSVRKKLFEAFLQKQEHPGI
jgi:nitroreductase